MESTSMKIKTEIFQSVYIITCDGPSLNPVLIQGFVTAMKSFIKKNNLDILLDLSGVEVVDSTQLGSIILFFEKIDGYGLLVLCGVSDRVISLLKMANLQGGFLQATTRTNALSTLFWEKKNRSSTTSSSERKSSGTKDESTTKARVAKKKVEEEAFEILDDSWEVVSEAEESEIDEGDEKEHREFQRVNLRQISDDDIVIYYKNLITGKHHTAILLDISLGGMLIALQRSELSIGEGLLMEGMLDGIKFKEQAVVCSSNSKGEYGLSYVNLSREAAFYFARFIRAVK